MDIKNDHIETTEHLLKGDYGFMCQYDNEPDFETVWSSVFDLESLDISNALSEEEQFFKFFI